MHFTFFNSRNGMGGVHQSNLPKAIRSKLSLEPKYIESESSDCSLFKFFSAKECSVSKFTAPYHLYHSEFQF